MQPPYRYVRNMPHDYRRPYGYGYGRRPRPFYGGGNALLGGFVGGLGGALVAPYLLAALGTGMGTVDTHMVGIHLMVADTTIKSKKRQQQKLLSFCLTRFTATWAVTSSTKAATVAAAIETRTTNDDD